MLWWREGAEWNLGEGSTDSAGITLIDAIHPGEIWIRIRAPGLLEFNYGPLRVEEQSTAPLLIDMQPAGTVTGRFLARGEPVSDFRVTYFSAHAKSPSTVVVMDEPQGEFEVREARLGPTVWIAAAPGYTPGEPSTVEVAPGEATRIELHLRPARAGQGSVVDALSGRPVRGARIESWIQFDGRWVRGTRIDAHSDHDGQLVFPALRPEGESLDVRAEGYVPRKVSVAPGAPIADARVHLESIESGERVADWIARGRVRNPVHGLRTDAQGVLRVLALPNGPYRYRTDVSDGAVLLGQLVVQPHAEGQVSAVFP